MQLPGESASVPLSVSIFDEKITLKRPNPANSKLLSDQCEYQQVVNQLEQEYIKSLQRELEQQMLSEAAQQTMKKLEQSVQKRESFVGQVRQRHHDKLEQAKQRYEVYQEQLHMEHQEKQSNFQRFQQTQSRFAAQKQKELQKLEAARQQDEQFRQEYLRNVQALREQQQLQNLKQLEQKHKLYSEKRSEQQKREQQQMEQKKQLVESKIQRALDLQNQQAREQEIESMNLTLTSARIYQEMREQKQEMLDKVIQKSRSTVQKVFQKNEKFHELQESIKREKQEQLLKKEQQLLQQTQKLQKQKEIQLQEQKELSELKQQHAKLFNNYVDQKRVEKAEQMDKRKFEEKQRLLQQKEEFTKQIYSVRSAELCVQNFLTMDRNFEALPENIKQILPKSSILNMKREDALKILKQEAQLDANLGVKSQLQSAQPNKKVKLSSPTASKQPQLTLEEIDQSKALLARKEMRVANKKKLQEIRAKHNQEITDVMRLNRERQAVRDETLKKVQSLEAKVQLQKIFEKEQKVFEETLENLRRKLASDEAGCYE